MHTIPEKKYQLLVKSGIKTTFLPVLLATSLFACKRNDLSEQEEMIDEQVGKRTKELEDRITKLENNAAQTPAIDATTFTNLKQEIGLNDNGTLRDDGRLQQTIKITGELDAKTKELDCKANLINDKVQNLQATSVNHYLQQGKGFCEKAASAVRTTAGDTLEYGWNIGKNMWNKGKNIASTVFNRNNNT